MKKMKSDGNVLQITLVLLLILSLNILTFLNLGRRFNMTRILVLLFPLITIPIMAFDKKYQLVSDDEV